MKFLRAFFLFLLAVVGVFFTTATAYYLIVTKDAFLDEKKLVLSEKTLIVYDQNGERVQGSTPKIKQSTAIERLPKHLIDAFVCVEDKRFFKHDGFDYLRFTRAVWNNFKTRSYKEGASTISQQLIKNTHLSQEKTLKRKLKEWKLTRELEKSHTKNEILEKYLNTIYFGHDCFGITSASEFYFGKLPEQLSVDETAILVGLVKSPNNYSPFRFPNRCQERKATVLRIMETTGVITKNEREKALNAPLPLPSLKNNGNGYLNFVLDELSVLSENAGFTIGGKTEIFTYLDPLLQDEILKTAKQNDCGSAVVVLDNASRGFKAAYSSIGNAKRLPGSLIKPLLVYAPALENNLISPATPILDEPINYGGYAPKNYDGRVHGYCSVRECVEKSLNVPAVKTLQALGVKKGAEYLKRLNLNVEEGDESLALALGGMKNGYALKDVVSAYSVFANDGNFQPGAFIAQIKINGESVYTRTNEQRKVFSSDTAYLTTDMLKSAVQNGTAKKLRSLPFEIAGKTGTVGTANGNTDAYAVSYTSNDVVGVWLGNDDNGKIEHTGGGKPCELAFKVNEFLHKRYKNLGKSIPSFTKPPSVVWVALDKFRYDNGHELLLADKNAPADYTFCELFKANQIPVKESLVFTSPTLLPPVLSITSEGVKISFDENTPTFYEYTITRRDGTREEVVYDGEFQPYFLDENVQGNGVYEYLVTPKYKNFVGKTLLLPRVSTKENAAQESEILSKEWWKNQ